MTMAGGSDEQREFYSKWIIGWRGILISMIFVGIIFFIINEFLYNCK